jgi:hypothetical protein
MISKCLLEYSIHPPSWAVGLMQKNAFALIELMTVPSIRAMQQQPTASVLPPASL